MNEQTQLALGLLKSVDSPTVKLCVLVLEQAMGSNELTTEEILTAVRLSKIRAIKMYRDRTGKGLLEAKNAIEAIGENYLGVDYKMEQKDKEIERLTQQLARFNSQDAPPVYRFSDNDYQPEVWTNK
jgi:ribosomal protein L7/L12